ncbi:hypothetical protein BESB_064890 [Besnoitia besnoiti]|uniref:Uncharacterized protein n=1 Tax=Besnoitia besnoiti TaxID=94643 RepID=A0A2A9M7K0_BESBE|nr:hypothetical protein BESB_064890 [Besnoitia besnoiti]PFH34458.1 hypothetical protein BESB_064890 [Besnoitia besnoiti]
MVDVLRFRDVAPSTASAAMVWKRRRRYRYSSGSTVSEPEPNLLWGACLFCVPARSVACDAESLEGAMLTIPAMLKTAEQFRLASAGPPQLAPHQGDPSSPLSLENVFGRFDDDIVGEMCAVDQMLTSNYGESAHHSAPSLPLCIHGSSPAGGTPFCRLHPEDVDSSGGAVKLDPAGVVEDEGRPARQNPNRSVPGVVHQGVRSMPSRCWRDCGGSSVLDGSPDELHMHDENTSSEPKALDDTRRSWHNSLFASRGNSSPSHKTLHAKVHGRIFNDLLVPSGMDIAEPASRKKAEAGDGVQSGIFHACGSCGGAKPLTLEHFNEPTIGNILSWYRTASHAVDNGSVRICFCPGQSQNGGQGGQLTRPALVAWQRSLLRELSCRSEIDVLRPMKSTFFHEALAEGKKDARDLSRTTTVESTEDDEAETHSSPIALQCSLKLPVCGHAVDEQAFRSCAAEAMREEGNMVYSSGAQWRVACPACGCRQFVGASLLSRLYMR